MTTTKEVRYLQHGLSVSMAIMDGLDIMQHAVNDKFFDNIWHMLKDGGIYVAPNGSCPTMVKDAGNRRWIIEFDTDHPKADLWRENLNG
jgi:hypothetical protein